VRCRHVRSTVFLGGGRITTALLAGLRLAGYKGRIFVHDRHPAKLRQLKQEYGIHTARKLTEAVSNADLLIIAVRPDNVEGLLRQVSKVSRPLQAVSLAAGIPIGSLHALLGPPVTWARAMPSPACRTRRGLTALTFEARFPSAARKEVTGFFEQVGPVLQMSENNFDVFTVTYSCSHGYHAVSALAGAAGKLGLDRKSALVAAAHALADGILSWREGDVSLRQLLQEAATPGGIASTVMKAMDAAGYQGVIEHGLRTGLRRARANAKR
jgi:pyrroline-5-carboxylate reductase